MGRKLLLNIGSISISLALSTIIILMFAIKSLSEGTKVCLAIVYTALYGISYGPVVYRFCY